MNRLRTLLTLPLLLFPVLAQAKVSDWFWHGFTGAAVLAALAAFYTVKRLDRVESKKVRVMLAGLFFWVYFFAEAMVYALLLKIA